MCELGLDHLYDFTNTFSFIQFHSYKYHVHYSKKIEKIPIRHIAESLLNSPTFDYINIIPTTKPTLYEISV